MKRCKVCGEPIVLWVLLGWQHVDIITNMEHKAIERRS